jgi:hypothetical protein
MPNLGVIACLQVLPGWQKRRRHERQRPLRCSGTPSPRTTRLPESELEIKTKKLIKI